MVSVMAYVGATAIIPLGQIGLRTDGPLTSMPPNALTKANNVSLFAGRIEKARGSTKYNSSALASTNIVAMWDWWPTPSLQRLIIATSDGKIWRDTGDGTFMSGSAIRNFATTITTDTQFCEGGQEDATNNKKLFIFTSAVQVHRISADGTSTSAITTPNADWSAGSYPSFGVLYQRRLCVLGSSANRHTVYFSLASDHEDFNTTPLTFEIFPGEGDGLISATVYKGLLMLFKRPYGVYLLDGRDPNTSNWTVSKFSDSFGIASSHSVVQALTDVVAANSFGSYTSLQASQSFGDFEAGDILANNEVEDYIRSEFSSYGLPYVQGIYYPEKKTIYFNGQSGSTDLRNKMLLLDMNKSALKLSLDTKEEPNCLALRRDSFGIQRPIAGDKDGFVWKLDQSSYNRDSAAYTGEFQTAYTDLGFVSSEIAGKNKIFEFIEVNFIATGNNNFYVDVYVDGSLRQTVTIEQFAGAALGSFELDDDTLGGDLAGARARKKLKSCFGSRISFRVYNSNADEGFKVERLIVGFRISDEQDSGSE
jgi:hypothetical protein